MEKQRAAPAFPEINTPVFGQELVRKRADTMMRGARKDLMAIVTVPIPGELYEEEDEQDDDEDVTTEPLG